MSGRRCVEPVHKCVRGSHGGVATAGRMWCAVRADPVTHEVLEREECETRKGEHSMDLILSDLPTITLEREDCETRKCESTLRSLII